MKISFLSVIAILTIISFNSFTYTYDRKPSGNDFIEKLRRALNQYNHVLPREKIYLHLDKPFYKPGDDIWIKAYLREGTTHMASTVSEIVYIELINPKGSIEKTIALIARNGTAHGDFQLGPDSPGGIYKIRAYTNWMRNFSDDEFFEKEAQVQTVLLPRLLMTVDFERESYGPGDTVTASLKLSGSENTPLANKAFNYIVHLGGREYKTGKSRTDELGKADMSFSLPERLQTTDGLLNAVIEYEGSNESISKPIPVVLNNISLQFFPEGGDLIRNVQSRVAFKAVNEFGKPADITGIVIDENGDPITRFQSFHHGMGAFPLLPEDNKQYFARITQPDGISGDYPLPPPLPKGYRLAAVLTEDSTGVEVDIHSPLQKKATLVAQIRGVIYFAREIKLVEGSNRIAIPVDEFPAGVVQLTLFDHKGVPRCERLFFTNPQKSLHIDISASKEKYLPGEPVEMTVKVSDEDGLPVAANLSLAVVDDKLISFADDRQDNILSYLLLSSDVKGKIDEPSFYFNKEEPEAGQALDYLLMTQGWRRFGWAEILETSDIQLNDKISYHAEKAIVRGTVVQFESNEPMENIKVTVLETEAFTYTNEKGEFEFDNLDLTTPLTLQAATEEDGTRTRLINDYSIGYSAGANATGKVVVQQNPEISLERDGIPMEVQGPGVQDEMKALMKAKKEEEAALPPIIEANENEEIEILMDVEVTEETVIEEIVFMEAPAEEVFDEVFTIVEKKPEPKGGMEELYKFITRNIRYPEQAMRIGIEGRVYVQFVVGEDGSIEDVKVVKGIGAGCDEEAARVIAASPAWHAGKQNGAPVKTRLVIPIAFNLNSYMENNGGLTLNIAMEPKHNGESQKARYYRARTFYSPQHESSKTREERRDFRQTIFWEPNLIVDKTGETKITFYNSDNISAFRATIEGVATSGAAGRQEFTYYTQLPFSVSAKIPQVLSFEDQMDIPVTLKNNTGHMVRGTLAIDAPESIRFSGKDIHQITIKANSAKTVTIPFEVLDKAGQYPVKISFKSPGMNDSFEQMVEVQPKGYPVAHSFSGKEAHATYTLSINDLVNNSLKARLMVYPDVISDLMSGIASILREPHGCFEQTSSSTYPNILALQYMQESDDIDAGIREKAQALIDKGYNKLTAFETKSNGYEWFGSVPPHEGLTAYGLMEFHDLSEVYASVEPAMMSRTTEWILNRRDGNGGFSRSPKALDQFGRASQEVSNAYIVYALSECGIEDIQKEFQFARESAFGKNDSYELALIANASFNLNKTSEGNQALEKLFEQIETHGYGKLEADHSITRSYGKSLQVETASLIVLAILASDRPDIRHLEKGIKYITSSRANHGGFGSTQATILALKALTKYARYSKRTNTSGTVEVYVGNKRIASRFYAKGTKGEIVIDGLQRYLSEGTQTVTIKYLGTNEPLPYSLDVEWSTYTPDSQPECKVELQTRLSRSAITLGETVRLTSAIKNPGKEGLPMTVAAIGIPSGLSPQPWQLKDLQETRKIDFYEVRKNYVVLYFRQLLPEAIHELHLDLKSEITGNFESPASSAYLYYTSEFKSWDGGTRIVIK